MKNLSLKGGLFATVDDEDFQELKKYSWRSERHGVGYRICRSRRASERNMPKKIFIHRVILKAQPGQIIDHIDGNALNNQKANLRFCTQAENSRNTPSRRKSTSRFTGVSWHKQNRKWQAQIQKNGKTFRLGEYPTQEEAAVAYNYGAREHFGEFARLNAVHA